MNPSPLLPPKKCQSEGGPALTKIRGGGGGRTSPAQQNVSLRGPGADKNEGRGAFVLAGVVLDIREGQPGPPQTDIFLGRGPPSPGVVLDIGEGQMS